jgi:hypothetical protein
LVNDIVNDIENDILPLTESSAEANNIHSGEHKKSESYNANS